MKVGCLLVLLCVAMVYEADAGWWGKATRWVGNAVGSVVGMLGKKQRRRRELKEDLDPETLKAVEKVCTDSHLKQLTPDGIPFEVVKVSFEKVDEEGDKNEALEEGELDSFLNTLEVFKHCMKQDDQAQAA